MKEPLQQIKFPEILVEKVKNSIAIEQNGDPATFIDIKHLPAFIALLQKFVEPTKVEEPKQPKVDLGICQECKRRPAVRDYNGHACYVCDSCNESMNNYFDEEYR